MKELISRIVANVGVDADAAEKAVGLILAFLDKEGDAAAVSAMMAKIPGAAEIAAANAGNLGGGFMGGGIMGLGQSLMGLGLGMGELTGVAKETIAHAKEMAGAPAVDAVVASIPGLSQFV